MSGLVWVYLYARVTSGSIGNAWDLLYLSGWIRLKTTLVEHATWHLILIVRLDYYLQKILIIGTLLLMLLESSV